MWGTTIANYAVGFFLLHQEDFYYLFWRMDIAYLNRITSTVASKRAISTESVSRKNFGPPKIHEKVTQIRFILSFQINTKLGEILQVT